MGERTKRGAAGVANALSSPFRLNGLSRTWQARRMGCYRVGAKQHGGSVLLRGMLGGLLASKIGLGQAPISNHLAVMTSEAMKQAPVMDKLLSSFD